MQDLAHIDQELNRYLRLQTFPVAVSLLESPDDLPGGMKDLLPKAQPMPVCQGISISRRYGWPVVLGAQQMTCPLGALALGLVEPKERFLDGTVEVPYWVRSKEARARIAANMPKLPHGKYQLVVSAPLAQAQFEPDLIVVYGNPAQMMRLVQGSIYLTGQPVVSNSLGAVGCATYISKALMSGESQMVVCGAGDRIFALTQDDEMCFTIPLARAQDMLTGLAETHKYGLRYPTSSYLRFQPEMPGAYRDLLEQLNQ